MWGSTNEREITFLLGAGDSPWRLVKARGEGTICGHFARGTSMLNANRGGKVQDRSVQGEQSHVIEVWSVEIVVDKVLQVGTGDEGKAFVCGIRGVLFYRVDNGLLVAGFRAVNTLLRAVLQSGFGAAQKVGKKSTELFSLTLGATEMASVVSTIEDVDALGFGDLELVQIFLLLVAI